MEMDWNMGNGNGGVSVAVDSVLEGKGPSCRKPPEPRKQTTGGLATAAIICSWGNYPGVLPGRHGPTIKRLTNETERGLEHAKYV